MSSVEVKNEILNLRQGYCIIFTTSGQINLRCDERAEKNYFTLDGRNFYNCVFCSQREYDFTKYYEGGKI